MSNLIVDFSRGRAVSRRQAPIVVSSPRRVTVVSVPNLLISVLMVWAKKGPLPAPTP